MRRQSARLRPPRRGLTLVEMLVSVALVLLIMTIIVSVFRAAATATSAAKVYIELDQSLRRLDTLIRQDLEGATARFTPPVKPLDSLGYFEYSENALSDAQDEDSDDTMAFTVKAPEGLPFRGYMVIGGRRVPITSDYAEVIYFLRNNNLYRRVLLIAPEKQSAVTTGPLGGGGYLGVSDSPYDGYPTSWIANNTLSARPSIYPANQAPGAPTQGASYGPRLNTLGDLTNRENRAFHPRFTNDYVNNFTGATPPDGLPDDANGDGVPDYYPTIYPNLGAFLNDNAVAGVRAVASIDTLAFPYLFRGAYSQPGTPNATLDGGLHVLDPTNPGAINHYPIPNDQGIDNLSPPAGLSTWWGYPTYQETLSPYWTDPVKRMNDPSGTAYFSSTPLNTVDMVHAQAPGLSWLNVLALPPMTGGDIPDAANNPTGVPYRRLGQPYTDGAGAKDFAVSPVIGSIVTATGPLQALLWQNAGESEDLVLTGVRSFNIKAYDYQARRYVDLGYGNITPGNTTSPAFIQNTSILHSGLNLTLANELLLGFGHEGRMPPIRGTVNPGTASDGTSGDFRLDPQWPIDPALGVFRYVGDNGTSTIRMRRTWDSWSTAYTNAPDVGMNPASGAPFASPLYPSFPPPYPAALRGIEIQIRIVDPRNERVKSLTIRHDFTDKL